MTAYNDNTIMPFGKHKGKTLAEVPDEYLDWLYSALAKKKKMYFDERHMWSYLCRNIDAIRKNIGK